MTAFYKKVILLYYFLYISSVIVRGAVINSSIDNNTYGSEIIKGGDRHLREKLLSRLRGLRLDLIDVYMNHDNKVWRDKIEIVRNMIELQHQHELLSKEMEGIDENNQDYVKLLTVKIILNKLIENSCSILHITECHESLRELKPLFDTFEAVTKVYKSLR